jgi:REP-associated tyrosine transposase
MARPLRIEYEGAFYHVTARGNERKKIFLSKRDQEKFLQYVTEARDKYRFILHAYVIMGNHYHLVIETPEGNLSRIMHYINSSYTTYTNVKRKRNGHLFQGRYKAIIVDKDSYLLEVSRYLHLNPVRANMAQHPEEYQYSSYRSYISSGPTAVVSTDTILGMLGGDPSTAKERYRIFVGNAFAADQTNPFKNLYGGMILGSERFIRTVLDTVEDLQLQTEQTSNRKELRKVPVPEELVAVVAYHFGATPEAVLKEQRSMARKAFVYLVKKRHRYSNREIGELLGCHSISAATKIYQSFERQMAIDSELQKQMKTLESKLSTF